MKYKESHNNEVFELIIDKFKNLIKKYVNKVDIIDREDIEQEILIKIHNICSSFKILDNQSLDNEKQFIKYIDVTVRNVYIDYLRTKVENKETLIENTDSIEEKNRCI